MQFLILAALFAARPEPPWVITDVVAESQSVPDVTAHVYPIRMRSPDGRTSAAGCAVSVGNGALQTVAHVLDIPSGICEVQVGGEWKRATFRVVDSSPAGDVAIVRVTGDLPAPTRRAPRYMERVFVYGLKTGSLQCGVVSGTRSVSLNENETGTQNGDSGGGVFSETGEFLGTIQGSDAAENRVVMFRPNNFEINFPVAGKSPAAAPATVKTAPATTTVCENGVCRQVPVQQSAAQNGHWEHRVGLFGRTHTVWVPNQ